MIRAVLFDLDGTLLPLHYPAFEKALFGAYGAHFARVLPGVEVLGPLLQALQKILHPPTAEPG